MQYNVVYWADCVKGMKLWGGTADLILTDPPYNISVDNNFNTMGNRQGIDFGEWDKGFDLTGWIPTAVQCLKCGGSIIIFNAWRNLGIIADALEQCGCSVKQTICWVKTNPMPRNRDRLYVNSYELAIWATKGDGWTYNRQRDTYENGIFRYPAPAVADRVHPTQKPIQLMRDLVAIHSNLGDVVMDPFTGSGSTLLAARDLGRKYVGFEINRTYCAAASARLAYK